MTRCEKRYEREEPKLKLVFFLVSSIPADPVIAANPLCFQGGHPMSLHGQISMVWCYPGIISLQASIQFSISAIGDLPTVTCGSVCFPRIWKPGLKSLCVI